MDSTLKSAAPLCPHVITPPTSASFPLSLPVPQLFLLYRLGNYLLKSALCSSPSTSKITSLPCSKPINGLSFLHQE